MGSLGFKWGKFVVTSVFCKGHAGNAQREQVEAARRLLSFSSQGHGGLGQG